MANANPFLLAQAKERLKVLSLVESFDAHNLGSRPNPVQLEYLKDINNFKIRLIRAGGQAGKSSTIAREYAWVLTDTHPYWKRPESWGTEPYLLLVAGQDRKMMETEIWGKKLQPFLEGLEPGMWRPVRSGNALQHIEHRKKGHKVVFLSHADSSETNRKHMQGYVAHFVWMDELSNSISIIEELQRRVIAKDGWFSLSFTPKGKSEDIRKWADAIAEPSGKVYRMGMLDNPLFKGREDDLRARLDSMPEGMRNTVLYGDWEIGESSVYQFTWEMVEKPDNYDPRAWRHVEWIDPAVSGVTGLLIAAEDPRSGVWYTIKSIYIEDLFSPDRIVQKVKDITSPYNIVRRVTDTAPWYYGMASQMGMSYMFPPKKNERKEELIKGLQLALTTGRLKIAPWCSEFISELQTAQWAENEGKPRIVNRKNLHLQDAAQYGIDCLPPSELKFDDRPWWDQLRDDNDKRKKREATDSKVAKPRVQRKTGRWALRSNQWMRLS